MVAMWSIGHFVAGGQVMQVQGSWPVVISLWLHVCRFDLGIFMYVCVRAYRMYMHVCLCRVCACVCVCVCVCERERERGGSPFHTSSISRNHLKGLYDHHHP